MDKVRLLREAKSLPVSEILLLITDVIVSLEERALVAEAQLAELPNQFRDMRVSCGIGACTNTMNAQHTNIGINWCIEIVEQAILGKTDE